MQAQFSSRIRIDQERKQKLLLCHEASPKMSYYCIAVNDKNRLNITTATSATASVFLPLQLIFARYQE
jgi:hypothetical protein